MAPLGNDFDCASERARCAWTLGAARAWDAGIVTYMRMLLLLLEPSLQLLFFRLLTACIAFGVRLWCLGFLFFNHLHF